jgi:hypothetical protein
MRFLPEKSEEGNLSEGKKKKNINVSFTDIIFSAATC